MFDIYNSYFQNLKIGKNKLLNEQQIIIRTLYQKYIAFLLSYDIIDYHDFYNNNENLIVVDYYLTDDKTGIFGYYTYKTKKLNKILKPLNKSCKLSITSNTNL